MEDPVAVGRLPLLIGDAPPLDDAAIELGPVYRSGAVTEDGRKDGAPLDDPRAPAARPGTRVPHVWLDGEETRSTLDLAGRGFTLLVGNGAWAEAAVTCGIPARRIGADTRAALRLAGGEALLLRPDGVIGWRSGPAPGSEAARLDGVLRRLACR